MKPLPHSYRVSIASGPGPYAVLDSAGVTELATAPPLEFDGPGDAWSPEQLVVGAVASCFVHTFRAVARASKIDVTSLTVWGEGVVDRVDGLMRFTEIVLQPRLTLPATVERPRVERAMEKAKHACLVSASLVAPVRLEPEIVFASS
jgi:peroxiredoxin-like protein